MYFLDNPPSQNARSPEKKAPAAKPRHEPARNGHLEKFELPVVVVVVVLLLLLKRARDAGLGAGVGDRDRASEQGPFPLPTRPPPRTARLVAMLLLLLPFFSFFLIFPSRSCGSRSVPR